MDHDKEKAIEKKIKDALRAEPELNQYDINIDYDDGKVLMTGVIDVLNDKTMAENIVAGFPEVSEIENGLTIGNEKLYDDDEIKEFVETEFENSGEIDLYRIGVEVSNGKVTLVGHADSIEEAEKAKKVASRVQGVRSVHSQLKID